VKEQSYLIAQVTVVSLTSQPVADEVGAHFSLQILIFLPLLGRCYSSLR